MVLDPKKHADWEIAQDAETRMKTVQQLGRDMGLLDKELLPYGHVMGKVDYRAVLERLGDKPNGKYVDVTAITPTPLGEGKSTTTIGLVQGLGRRNKRASAAIRQPSGGPTMGVKGSAAGGGLSQCIPLTQYSLGFTGDINAVMNAHNLAMVALTSRMQHERNYNDEKLLKLSGMPRLNIDPTNVNMGWVMDFCCQSLRNIIIGMDGTNGRSDGFMMRSRFDIAVSSEVMAILAIAKDLKDLRQRMGKIIVAYDRDGKPVTTADLEVDGAMTAWMVEAINPNLIQTIEGQPVFVHAGPFANIAIGQSSVIADRIGLKLNEYHVTESGFGADIGYEKFWNLKCHYSGLTPDAAVVVATVRAVHFAGHQLDTFLKRHIPRVQRLELGLVVAGVHDGIGQFQRAFAAVFPVRGLLRRGVPQAGRHPETRRRQRAWPVHGEDAPVPVRRSGRERRSQGVEAAYPRRAHLRRRGLRGSGFRFHHAHARNGLQSFFPQGRRGRRYRQGEGDLLICVRIGGKPSSGLSSSFF